MSCFKCPNCAERWFIFGEGGSRRTAAEMGIEVAGEVGYYSLYCSQFVSIPFGSRSSLISQSVSISFNSEYDISELLNCC